MTVLYNLAKVSTATTGTSTITLGSATTGYLTFAQAGVQNGDVVAYGIRDGANSEVGTGTYTASGTTLTRNVTKSTNSNNPINLSGTAEVYITARSEDIVNKTGDTMTGALTLLNTGLKVQDTDASHTLSIVPGTNLTANRTLTFTTGDANRNITLQGDTTIPAVFPTVTTDNTLPRFDGTSGSFQTSGVTVDDSNNVTGVNSIDIGNADTTISRASAGVIAVEGSNVLMASNIGSTVQGYNANLNSLASVYTAPTAINPAQFNLLEATNNGSNYLTLLAPNSITSNKNVAFQDVAGTVYVSNGTDVAVADGGTGASDAATARSNLGLGALATGTYPGAGIVYSTGSAWASSYSTSGSGNVALTTSATLTTPVINGFSGNTSAITIGTNQFVKDVSGNIGIGTSSPSTYGKIAIDVANYAAPAIRNFSTGSGAGSISGFESIGYRTDGNVSFGARLGLSLRRSDGTAIGATQNLGYVAFGGQYGTDTSLQLNKVLYSASILGVAEGNFTANNAMATAITFNTGSTGNDLWSANVPYGTERMRINSNGGVGIGTSTPNSNASYGWLTINGPSGGGSILSFSQNNSEELRIQTIYGLNVDLNVIANLPLLFKTNNTERMRIDATGNVGIGTSSPSARCYIYSASATPFSIENNSNGTYPTALFGSSFDFNFSSGDAELSFWNAYTSAGTSFVFRQLTGASSRTDLMTIRASGNVGIGTSSPGQKLSVAGTVESTSGGFKYPDSTTQTTAFVLGPAFSAYQSSAQSALSANTLTKIALQTKEFDTANCFDNTTNYRFTPNVAGYYQINGAVQMSGSTAYCYCSIFKNGSDYKQGSYVPTTSNSPKSVVSVVLYLNGSTDYVELYAATGSSVSPISNSLNTYFNGCFLRSG